MFQLNKLKSNKKQSVYTLISGTISGTDDSRVDEDHWWTGELPPQSLAPGSAEIIVERKTGATTMVLNVPGISGMQTDVNGSDAYQRESMLITFDGQISLSRRSALRDLDIGMVDPDPWTALGASAYPVGGLIVR